MKNKQQFTQFRPTPTNSRVIQPFTNSQGVQLQYQPYVPTKNQLVMKPQYINQPSQLQNIGSRMSQNTFQKPNIQNDFSKTAETIVREKRSSEHFNDYSLTSNKKEKQPIMQYDLTPNNKALQDQQILARARSMSPIYEFYQNQCNYSSLSSIKKEIRSIASNRETIDSKFDIQRQDSSRSLSLANPDKISCEYNEEKAFTHPFKQITEEQQSKKYSSESDITMPRQNQRNQTFQKQSSSQSQLVQNSQRSDIDKTVVNNNQQTPEPNSLKLQSFTYLPESGKICNVIHSRQSDLSQPSIIQNKQSVSESQVSGLQNFLSTEDPNDQKQRDIQSNQVTESFSQSNILMEEVIQESEKKIFEQKKDIMNKIDNLEQRIQLTFLESQIKERRKNLKYCQIYSLGSYQPEQNYEIIYAKNQFEIIKSVILDNSELFTSCSSQNQLNGSSFSHDTTDIKQRMSEAGKKTKLIDMLREELGSKDIKIAEKSIELNQLTEKLMSISQYLQNSKIANVNELKALLDLDQMNDQIDEENKCSPQFRNKFSSHLTFNPDGSEEDPIVESYDQLRKTNKQSLLTQASEEQELYQIDLNHEKEKENFQLKIENQMLKQQIQEQEKLLKQQANQLSADKLSGQKQFQRQKSKQLSPKNLNNQICRDITYGQFSDESYIHGSKSIQDSTIIQENQDDFLYLLLTQASGLEDCIKRVQNK